MTEYSIYHRFDQTIIKNTGRLAQRYNKLLWKTEESTSMYQYNLTMGYIVSNSLSFNLTHIAANSTHSKSWNSSKVW